MVAKEKPIKKIHTLFVKKLKNKVQFRGLMVTPQNYFYR